MLTTLAAPPLFVPLIRFDPHVDVQLPSPSKSTYEPWHSQAPTLLCTTQSELVPQFRSHTQIGVPLRVVIFGVSANPRYPDAEAVPETVLINPVIEPLDDSMDEAWEGCLSVPGMRGLVPRYRRIRYRGMDEHGVAIDRTVQDFHAREAKIIPQLFDRRS